MVHRSLLEKIWISCSNPSEHTPPAAVAVSKDGDDTASTNDNSEEHNNVGDIPHVASRTSDLLKKWRRSRRGNRDVAMEQSPRNDSFVEDTYVFLRGQRDCLAEIVRCACLCDQGAGNAVATNRAAVNDRMSGTRQKRNERFPADRPRSSSAFFRAAGELSRSSVDEVAIPLNSLVVADVRDLESISELTMKSSHDVNRVGDSRKMAYYAISERYRKKQGSRHNRRCYFSGKLILSPTPYYAGCVQQGLKTLVVFCLPTSIGLLPSSLISPERGHSTSSSHRSQSFSKSSSTTSTKNSLNSRSNGSHRSGRRQRSQLSKGSTLSSNTDLTGSDLGEEHILDAHEIFANLPDDGDIVIEEMKKHYPNQFELLPVQARSANCWRLYMKFCFFSGLPIAEDEPHYRIKEEYDIYDEEIHLSYEVIEAACGVDSATLLRKPNRRTFQYLQKHYPDQCRKLDKTAFDRKCWEQILAEI